MTTTQTLDLLRKHESRNVTFIERDDSWPIVWKRAAGVHVWDAEGRRYLDLTAAFGVAAAGHANPRVVRAGQRQMATLLHAMGDVHPHELKAKLARELSRITFERWSRQAAKTIFCNSGFEAVEAALKTAMLATNRRGVIAFEGAYHGLGYGALNATFRAHFRSPFRSQLGQFGQFLPFPRARADGGSALRGLAARIRKALGTGKVGAVLVEPIQVRGGINIPEPGFLPLLRGLCDQHDAWLILDEIYTGFGRTGKWFACDHYRTHPDLICVGKALTGGFPLSACIGPARLMDRAWPKSTGEAIHTSTFLGHPVGCAMALAQIKEIEQRRLAERSAVLGKSLIEGLARLRPRNPGVQYLVRGLGLLAGIELRFHDGTAAAGLALKAVKRLLQEGYIFLTEGEHSNVIAFTPPLIISHAQIQCAVRALARALEGT
jgi:4-aminobutyrate aminotransferase-like enzyme